MPIFDTHCLSLSRSLVCGTQLQNLIFSQNICISKHSEKGLFPYLTIKGFFRKRYVVGKNGVYSPREGVIIDHDTSLYFSLENSPDVWTWLWSTLRKKTSTKRHRHRHFCHHFTIKKKKKRFCTDVRSDMDQYQRLIRHLFYIFML